MRSWLTYCASAVRQQGVVMEPKDELRRYLTAAEAAERVGYARPDSFRRAWVREKLPLYRRPGGTYLVDREDLRSFVRSVDR